jgi:hypothetical protein
MEIKHTIEILTKDIQDIENLVRNLNKYPTPPRIEIDLAMTKLRNVYELLAMISSDLRKDLEKETEGYTDVPIQTSGIPGREEMQQPAGGEQQPNSGSPEPPLPKPAEEEAGKKEMEQTMDKSSGAVAEESQKKAPEKKEKAEESQTEFQEGTPVQKKEFIEERMEEAAGNRSQEPVPEKFKEEVKKASIIAEKFAANKSINEKIAPEKTTDLSSKLTGEPIDSVKRNIGINDRFLIIRELLNGDNEGYNQLVQQLDTCQGFDQAYGLIEKSFPDKMDHEGVELLIRLSRRRFLSKDV